MDKDIIFGIPYILLSLFHCTICFHKKEKIKIATKPLLMIALLFYYINAAKQINLLTVLTLICHWLGDVALLYEPLFFFGVFIFWLGDCFYCYTLYKNIPNILSSKFMYFLSFYVPIYLYIVAFRLKKYLSQLLYIICYFFGFPLLMMVILSSTILSDNFYGLYDKDNFIKDLVLTLGCISFFFSDFTIIRNVYVEPVKQADFVIMSSYLFAEGSLIYWISNL